ncbi:Fic family protein [Flexibacterium corallicola]|uniref:Fic family protein n=1 Tax=Flexibacterium corallicola TaxID=3037259 RepID=UPI00286F2230|nr:Fic family protein [Pseudovibrio sp. M1P-2-3]
MPQTFFSQPVNIFHESRLPEPALPVGYAALIKAFELEVPLPFTLSAIGARHKIYEENGWRIYTPRHEPAATLEGHLVFALKYEGLDLALLKKLFHALPTGEIEELIRAKPTSRYMRRIWFLYEWLLDEQLNLPDAKAGTYADIVDTKLQWGARGSTSTRHRVRNNLTGSNKYCPLIRRTEKLEHYVAAKLDEQAQDVVGKLSAGVLARTAAFLLLKDSKSSYAIEGEAPPHNRIQRWGKAIGEAGKHPLDMDEFLRLQHIVIGKERFIKLGLRHEGGFVGEHEPETRLPLPEHISAKHDDLPGLMEGLIEFDNKYAGALDPVLAAASLAFGFVYIHPFEDGNGRIHRYLIHHVLTTRGFNPPGIVFPVSSAILERIDDYRKVLEIYSQRLLPFIEWKPSIGMNVEVINDTADFYRFFDATSHAEFLYNCVQQTIEKDLPEQAAFLENYDFFKTKIEAVVEMPASMIDLLFNFLKQNAGKLSKRAMEREFQGLTAEEIHQVEAVYRESFARI